MATAPHPIRVVVTDDLERSRLTVFFRILLAIPHFIWLFLWSIAAIVAAIANWVATLVQGIPPRPLHRFLAAYVRYATHFWAYLHLAANPYPGFDGSPGYPVDVEIDEPGRQSRWHAGFRLVLAVPAILVASVLAGNNLGFGQNQTTGDSGDRMYGFGGGSVGVIATVALLGWFPSLIQGRMPRGFRDLEAYVLRYAAQTWGYVFLLTDRYPDANPAEPRAPQPPEPHPIGVNVTDDGRRSKLTVFFRILLVIPHLVWLTLWGIAVFFAAIAAWFAAVATGRVPQPLHRFLAGYVRYSAHVAAFLYLVANPFPGFTGEPGYPLDAVLPGAPERQNRWKTGFRFILAIPALIVSSSLGAPLLLVGVFGWFTGLAVARVPEGLRNLGAYVIRYNAQTYGYLLLLTERYPDSGPLQRPADEQLALAPEA